MKVTLSFVEMFFSSPLFCFSPRRFIVVLKITGQLFAESLDLGRFNWPEGKERVAFGR